MLVTLSKSSNRTLRADALSATQLKQTLRESNHLANFGKHEPQSQKYCRRTDNIKQGFNPYIRSNFGYLVKARQDLTHEPLVISISPIL